VSSEHALASLGHDLVSFNHEVVSERTRPTCLASMPSDRAALSSLPPVFPLRPVGLALTGQRQDISPGGGIESKAQFVKAIQEGSDRRHDARTLGIQEET
jgi:hypothetical protein